MNCFVKFIFLFISTDPSQLAHYNNFFFFLNLKTKTSMVIQTAVSLLLPCELLEYVFGESFKSVTK
ncbi:unnamed protein product [Lymnaea stagnalis]|uniref:Uncharacterized protein n=1 Tax=Lymnaea stagnalis TaxID=6523 RepID=A0AAV2ISQ4_LYMST